MNRIIKIGMDVHTTNYTLCIFEPSFEHDATVHCITQVKTSSMLLKLLKRSMKMKN